MNEKERSLVYSMMLSGPGMPDVVKLNINVSKQVAFLLFMVLQSGLGKDETHGAALLETVPEEIRATLQTVAVEILEKSNLVQLYEQFKMLLEMK